jgi:hypothetical protein
MERAVQFRVAAFMEFERPARDGRNKRPRESHVTRGAAKSAHPSPFGTTSVHLKLNFRENNEILRQLHRRRKTNIMPTLTFQELRCVSTAHGDWQTSLYAVGEGSCPADIREVRNPSTTRSAR